MVICKFVGAEPTEERIWTATTGQTVRAMAMQVKSKSHISGAEINGWIVAINVESRNGNDYSINHDHVKRCVKHMIENLPVNAKRIYFSGSSGDGALAYYNAARMRAAGGILLGKTNTLLN